MKGKRRVPVNQPNQWEAAIKAAPPPPQPTAEEDTCAPAGSPTARKSTSARRASVEGERASEVTARSVEWDLEGTERCMKKLKHDVKAVVEQEKLLLGAHGELRGAVEAWNASEVGCKQVGGNAEGAGLLEPTLGAAEGAMALAMASQRETTIRWGATMLDMIRYEIASVVAFRARVVDAAQVVAKYRTLTNKADK